MKQMCRRFTAPECKMDTIAFPETASTVAVWDLRKMKVVTSINFESMGASVPYRINLKAQYDLGAHYYLGIAGSDIRVVANKTWAELVRLEGGSSEVMDFTWGMDAKDIWGASGREVHIWSVSD